MMASFNVMHFALAGLALFVLFLIFSLYRNPLLGIYLSNSQFC